MAALGGCDNADTPEIAHQPETMRQPQSAVDRPEGSAGQPAGPDASRAALDAQVDAEPDPAAKAMGADVKPEAPSNRGQPAAAPLPDGPGAAASDPDVDRRARAVDPAPVAPRVEHAAALSPADRAALVEAALAGVGAEAEAAADVEGGLAGRAGAGDGSGTIGLARRGVIGHGAGRAAAALDDAPGPAERAGAMDPVPGALGLSPSIQLFTFRADPDRGLAAHPVQCRPERILETVAAVINRAAGPCEAQRNLLAQAGIELAYVTCTLADAVPGCRRTYIGTLWVERTPGTYHDYQLQGFGRIARQCGARTERLAGPVDRRVARHGEALGKLFDICGDRLTMGATSSSASTTDGLPPR